MGDPLSFIVVVTSSGCQRTGDFRLKQWDSVRTYRLIMAMMMRGLPRAACARAPAFVSILLRRSFPLSTLMLLLELLLLLYLLLFRFFFGGAPNYTHEKPTTIQRKNWLYKDGVRDGDGIIIFVLSDSNSRWNHKVTREPRLLQQKTKRQNGYFCICWFSEILVCGSNLVGIYRFTGRK